MVRPDLKASAQSLKMIGSSLVTSEFFAALGKQGGVSGQFMNSTR